MESISNYNNCSHLLIQYKRIYIKQEITRNHITFLHKCLKNHLTPNFAKIKHTHLNQFKTQHTARQILKDEVKKHYKTVNYCQRRLLELYRNITRILHQTEYENFIFNLEEETITKVRLDKRRKINKFKNLSKYRRNHRNIEATEDKFTNLTNITFNKEERDLLNRGGKHGLKEKPNLLMNAIEIETQIKGTQQEKELRKECINFIKNEERRINREINTNKNKNKDYRIIRQIKNKIESNNLIVTKADKNAGMVILHKNDYISKTEEFMKNNHYNIINKNPLNNLILKVKSCINNTRDTIMKYTEYNNYQMKQIVPMNNKLPTLYAMPKLHKENIPIRPIVTSINTPTYNLSKIILKIFNKMKYKTKHTIKNSTELVDTLKTQNQLDKCKLISFDIVNLYSNVCIKETLNIIKHILQEEIQDNTDIENILHMIETITNNNFCTFNNKVYSINEGLPMGSPISGLLANIYIDYIENQYILNDKNPYFKKLRIWKRYMDDIICIWDGESEDLIKLHDYINGLREKLKFTIEQETNNKINFLDLTIKRLEHQIEYEIYRKPTQINNIISYTSNHHIQHKNAALNTYINRLHKIPLKDEAFQKELKYIKQLAKEHQFPEKHVDKIIHKYKIRQDPLYKPKEQKDIIYRCITYNDTNKRLEKLFYRNNIKLVYKTRGTLNNILNNAKDKIDTSNNSGIYRINCKDCNAIYIGQTGRQLKTRINEHKKNITSNVYQHRINSGHNIDYENTKLLHKCQKGKRMDLLEVLEICRHENDNKYNTINDKTQINPTPIFQYLRNI